MLITHSRFWLILPLCAFSTFLIFWKFSTNTNCIPPAITLENSPKFPPTTGCLPGIDGPLLTSTTGGRLGNQMYMYATMFATLQKLNGTRKGTVSPRMYHYLSEYFKISLPPLNLDKYKSVNWTQQNIDDNYPTSLALLSEPPCLRICCFPQQWELFNFPQAFIMQEFRFHDHIHESAKRWLSIARQTFFSKEYEENVTLIGVHVRRTDYLEHAKNMLKIDFPELPFYRGAMEYFAQKYSNAIFVVTSDDISYCKREFRNSGSLHRIYYAETEEHGDQRAGVDMAILANSHHVIYGVGTFGFWAAYLSSGEVVYCACTRNDSIQKDQHKFFLPTWTGIPVDGSLANINSKLT